MAVIAGGVGIRLEKPGVYTIGILSGRLRRRGAGIVHAVRAAVIIFAILEIGALFLLGSVIYT